MDNSEAEADLAMFGGAPPELLEALQGESGEFEVEPEAWPVVQLWMRVQTQWRPSMGGVLGLDYTAVDVVMRRAGIADESGEIFAGLQVMEVAALNAMRD